MEDDLDIEFVKVAALKIEEVDDLDLTILTRWTKRVKESLSLFQVGLSNSRHSSKRSERFRCRFSDNDR